MPLPEHMEYVSNDPDEHRGELRVKQDGNRCPECGLVLDGVDRAKHALSHWPARWDPNNPPSRDAVARRKALLAEQQPAQNTEHWR